jgi:hypothetical protein
MELSLQNQSTTFGFSSDTRRPASQALESSTDQLASRSFRAETHHRRPMINVNSMKRSRTLIGAFDFAELEKASKKVELSISFPEIEWPSSAGEDNESESEDVPRPSVKRPRLGLVRSSPSFNLVALSSSERINSGRYNSFC